MTINVQEHWQKDSSQQVNGVTTHNTGVSSSHSMNLALFLIATGQEWSGSLTKSAAMLCEERIYDIALTESGDWGWTEFEKAANPNPPLNCY